MSGLLYTTTCPYCPKTFHHGKVEEMLIGDAFNSQAGKLFQDFSRHLVEKHPHEWGKEVLMLPSMASTMLLLKVFARSTQDETIGAIVEWMRHQIHKLTSFHTPDEKIQAQIVALGLLPTDCETVYKMAKTLRDVLEELPPFVPPQPGVEYEAPFTGPGANSVLIKP